jgi:hypothetical protein
MPAAQQKKLPAIEFSVDNMLKELWKTEKESAFQRHDADQKSIDRQH